MDLHSGYPFWPVKNGLIRTYPPLDQSECADVAVIGGGITGALLARSAVHAGMDCVFLDRRNIGWGSTAASTALLQYELDTHLTDLCGTIGEARAVSVWKACWDALGRTEEVCRELRAGDFAFRDSVYVASTLRDVEPLRKEYELRRRHGFDVDWLDQAAIEARFDLKSDAGIRSRAAQIDAFQLTHALLDEAGRRGARIFARTTVTRIEPKNDRVLIHTARGPSLDCRYAVLACGYESLAWLSDPPPVDLNSSYAVVSEPLRRFDGWPGGCMFWETARPYCYARTTSDGRGILGGEDLPYRNAAAREAALPQQVERLKSRWARMFPRIPLEVAFQWTGTFAETRDGLPFVGFPAEDSRTFLALCYGGNGIVFSLIAGEMLVAAIQGRPHVCADAFAFGRSSAS